MHIDGQPLLSRATVSSGRILITFALGIILAKAYAIEPEIITILGVEGLKIANLSAPAMWVIGFMLIGYLINLWGDYTSFRAWNSGEKWQNGVVFGGRDKPLTNQIAALHKSIESLQSFKKGVANLVDEQPALSKHFKTHSEELTQLQERVENLKKGVESLSKQAKLVLYWWHFAVPLCLTIIAFFMLLLDIP